MASIPFPKLLERVTAYVMEHMSHYDASHDFSHIRRVRALAHHIAASSPPPPDSPPYNIEYITLAALLHDIGDRKYLREGDDPSTMVQKLLLKLGASPETAEAVQKIATHVSYTSEMKDPAVVLKVIKEYPELAVVQDADRIDAIGAVGIGRVFAFGAVNEERIPEQGLQGAVDHFEFKLEKLAEMMKTVGGREMARKRTERLKTFRGWWEEEVSIVGNNTS